MFSHKINNSNNCIIKNDDYFVVPFGHRCSSALACKTASIRKFSLPFDWTYQISPNKIQQVLENNFNEFIPNVYNNQFQNKYGILFPHFKKNIKQGIIDCERRIDRFINIINQSKKIYFIFINEDYLYNKSYRTDEFNDNMFSEMLKLENFIKNKYMNIDYNILFFNFKNHDIPTNSNIINIILNTSNLFDTYNLPCSHQITKYCGKILAELFNTKLQFGFNSNIYFN
jgi:hypothetical protein